MPEQDMSDAPSKGDLGYLKSLMTEGFTNWTADPLARPALERLAGLDLCRVVDESPGCWRVYQSPEQRLRALAALALASPHQDPGA